MKKRKKYGFIVLIALICILISSPCVLYASPVAATSGDQNEEEVSDRPDSSWLSGQNLGDVYGSAGDMDLSGEEEEEDEPSVFAALVISFFNGFTDKLYSLLDKAHITLDSIIMGRVDGHGMQIHSNVLGDHIIAPFTFELMKGNIYGIVAANVYSIIRSVMYVIALCAVMAKVVAAGWKGDGSRAIMALKNAVGELAVTFFMLLLMPYILDLVLYIRDVLLHLLYTGLAGSMGIDVTQVSGLVGVFQAVASKNFLNSLMYFGTVIITLWFLLQYISLALTFCIYFISFPFVCINSLFAKNEIVEWWKGIIGYSIVPVGDLVLMFLPALFGMIGDNFTISAIQFGICAMLIPARSVLRAAMGVRSNFAMEMAAMGALYGAGKMASGTMRAFGKVVGGVAGGVAGGVSDFRMGSMYSEAAKERVDLARGRYNDLPTGGENRSMPESSGGSASYGMGSVSLEGRQYSSGMGQREQREILDKYANTANFEDPAFRGMSNEKRAELYRKRGIQKLAGAALGGVTGLAAGAAGSVLGAGGGMFLGVDKASELSGAMAAFGATAGIQGVQTGITYGAGMLREIQKTGENFYSANEDYASGSVGKDARFGDYSSLMAHEEVPGVDMSSVGTSSSEQLAGEQPIMQAENADPVAGVPPVGRFVNISQEDTTQMLDDTLTLRNPEFYSDAKQAYEEARRGQERGDYKTEQECVDAMNAQMKSVYGSRYGGQLREKYPDAPDIQLKNHEAGLNARMDATFGYDEANGVNRWNTMAKMELGKDEFSFKDLFS